MHANKREEIEEVYAATFGVRGSEEVNTGDTLCDENKQVILESIEFPAPVISVAIEPKTKADQDKLGVAMQRLLRKIRRSVFLPNPIRPNADFRYGRTAPRNHCGPHAARI